MPLHGIVSVHEGENQPATNQAMGCLRGADVQERPFPQRVLVARPDGREKSARSAVSVHWQSLSMSS